MSGVTPSFCPAAYSNNITPVNAITLPPCHPDVLGHRGMPSTRNASPHQHRAVLIVRVLIRASGGHQASHPFPARRKRRNRQELVIRRGISGKQHCLAVRSGAPALSYAICATANVMPTARKVGTCPGNKPAVIDTYHLGSGDSLAGSPAHRRRLTLSVWPTASHAVVPLARAKESLNQSIMANMVLYEYGYGYGYD